MPEPRPVPVTYLFNRECPSHDEGLALLDEAARAAGVRLALERVEVRDDAQAADLAFPGSPTYLVAGRDPFPAEAPPHAPQADACRLYRGEGGRMGPLPARDALAAALAEAAA